MPIIDRTSKLECHCEKEIKEKKRRTRGEGGVCEE